MMTTWRSSIYKAVAPHLLIILFYIFAHGLVAYAIAPVQAVFLPEITIFACLIYLPHGIRVLAVLFYGWPAVVSLTIGNVIADIIFASELEHFFKDRFVFYSTFGGALSGVLAFELMRAFGYNLYAKSGAPINWKMILLVGAVASLFNSLFQSYIFSGVIFPGEELHVFFTTIVGDTLGLFVLMFILMYGFRWYRVRQSLS